MSWTFWAVLGISILIGFFGILYQRSRAQQLPDVSDEEFLRELKGYENVDDHLLLSERRRVGRILGIPATKLRPSQELADLADQFEFLGQFSIAWTDLDDEVRELRGSGRDYNDDSDLPATIGEMVGELAAGRLRHETTSDPEFRVR